MKSDTGSYHHGDLRTALLSEAAVMIADTGVDSVTMRAISARLGVSHAAPYRHFEDKNALLVAVAAAGFEQLGERLREAIEGSRRSSASIFSRLGEAYLRFAIGNPAHYRLMYGTDALARQNEPLLRNAADALLAQVATVMGEQQRAGNIKKQDPEIQAYVAWSAVHGLASLLVERQIDPSTNVDALINHTTRTLLDGLRPRKRD